MSTTPRTPRPVERGRVALQDPVSRLPGVGSARASRLAEAGLRTVADVLLHVPFRYEDRRRFGRIEELVPGEPATLFVRLSGARGSRMRRGGLRVEALADDGSEAIRVVWHNRYPSFLKAAQSGSSAVLYGSPAVTARGELRLENPETEFFGREEEADPLHSGRIVGITRRVADISPRSWRALVRRALDSLSPEFVTASAPLSAVRAALEAIHFPGELADAERARAVLAGEELTVLAARIEEKRARLRSRPGIRLAADEDLRRRAREALPFSLTGAQRRAVREIAADLGSGRAMARLLQGDVGSGKTVVAGLAFLLAARNGVQGALMAPTEILAEQHAASLSGWLEKAGVRLALLTGRVRGRVRRALLAALERGEVDVLIGTHALVESPVRFRRLGLVVVDEQHRFGVAHRSRLFGKGESPHVLVMTATPIPRSLAWAIYGELDVSVLDEKPPGRGPVLTRVRGEDARERIYRFAAERVRAGERVYVVVPAIEEGEREVAATRQTASRIASAVPGVEIATLHGRMPPEERSRVLADFSAGRVGILVSTTIVEVGVDVPEATFMVIENAETFGLAQLHQLRGRVGRSSRPSWCALIVGEGAGPEARSRLAVLEQTSDGFLIAEKDLEARGPGDLLGTRQSGLPPLRVADPTRDLERLAEARRSVAELRARGERIVSDLFGYA
ncbi:MAG TPA: ATP-dependent DNA helicase RecG [Thermoanaerobaculia bacterium]|nr:ATP-dependent DNA helicase RecG [Thermoanaerobaculia bacterium]